MMDLVLCETSVKHLEVQVTVTWSELSPAHRTMEPTSRLPDEEAS